jgi:hypothetical protein
MKQIRFNLFCIVLALALIPTIVNAQAPQLINYQGNLIENGTPVTGAVNITFSIFDVATAGTSLWTETQTGVNVANGVFQVLLGSATAFPQDLFTVDGDRFLEVSVGGTPLSPRYQFTSTAYALSAQMAEEVKPGEVVTSINNLEDDITLAAGENIDLSESGNTLTISSPIPDGSIPATKLSNEPGLAYENQPNSFLLVDTEHMDLVTVTIQVPEPGYVFLAGRGMVELNGTTDINGIRMQIDTAAAGGDQFGLYSYVLFNQFPSTGIHYFDCSAQRTYIIDTPGEYTFRLEARKFGTNGTARIYWPILTAQYFPTAYGNVIVTSSNSPSSGNPNAVKPTQ